MSSRENVPIPGSSREPVPGPSRRSSSPVAGPSRISARGRGGSSGSGSGSGGGRRGGGGGGASRGGHGRPPFIIYGKKNQPPPREKPIVIAIPSADGGEGPQFDPPNPNPPGNYTMSQSNEKYPDWKLYLPREAFIAGSLNERKVAAFEGHITRNPETYNLRQIYSDLHFNLTLSEIADEVLQGEWENFNSDLANKPEETLAFVSIAMHHRILHFLRNEDIRCLKTISPRVVGYQPTTKLKSIKMDQCDKMISFAGTIIRLGPPEFLCTWMAFRCFSCGTPQAVLQPDGIFVQPKKCMNTMCHNKDDFEVLTRSLYTRVTEVQTLLVEESIKTRDPFTKPKSIEVILTEDLVNSVQAGGDIGITGVLKLRKDTQVADKAQYGIYCIHAVNVVSTSNPVVKESTEFTEKSLRAIEMIKTDPFPLRLLVQSLCPEVRGNEMIKFGFLLSLFSANQSTDKTIRKEVHTLVVGDPGLGKSCLLKACCSVAPRAIFTSCTGSSVSGLTATVKAEKEEGACSIEAGALVLADQGVCCIDEFDKMASNHASMLEVMEQQTVSIAKSGAICTLPAKTVILAAGNPVDGHYNRSKTVCENIKMHPAILSRFDISFIMLDHHRKDNWFLRVTDDAPTDVPLNERLELRPGEDMDALPHELFRKYIQYALENVKTRLTDEVGDLLVNFWLKLRRMQDKNDHIPITTRQLVGLMRMTMARARIDLCEETELRHANDVIELMKYSMADVLSPDGGTTVDWQRGMHGSGMSQSQRVRKFHSEIQKRAEQKKKKLFHYDELKSIAEGLRLQIFLNDILDSLNVQGMIINKGNSFYQLL